MTLSWETFWAIALSLLHSFVPVHVCHRRSVCDLAYENRYSLSQHNWLGCCFFVSLQHHRLGCCLSSHLKRFLPPDNGWLTLVIVGGVLPAVSDGVFPLNIISGGFCLVMFEQILTSLLWKQTPWKPPWNRPHNLVFGGHDYTSHDVIYMWCSSNDVIDQIIKYRWFQLSHSNLELSFSAMSPKEAFDKSKDIRGQNEEILKSTILSRMRIHTNWYSINISKHVTDAMAFPDTIWKAKEAMPIWHTHRIKVRQIGKKKDNIIQWLLLACKAYLARRKQRSISFFLIFCLQCMAHISAYVIICNSMFCSRLCNTLGTSIF